MAFSLDLIIHALVEIHPSGISNRIFLNVFYPEYWTFIPRDGKRVKMGQLTILFR